MLFCVCINLCSLLPEYEPAVRACIRHYIRRQLSVARFVHSTLGTELVGTMKGYVQSVKDGIPTVEEGLGKTLYGWYAEEVEGVILDKVSVC